MSNKVRWHKHGEFSRFATAWFENGKVVREASPFVAGKYRYLPNGYVFDKCDTLKEAIEKLNNWEKN